MRIAYDQKTDTLSVILKEGVATLACLGGVRHEKRHMDGVVFVDVGDHGFEIGPQLGKPGRIAVERGDHAGQRTDRRLLSDAKMLRAQGWRE